MPTFDRSSWARLERDFNEHIESADPEAAWQAARALYLLLSVQSSAKWGPVPAEPVAAALTAALQRHPQSEGVQRWGCHALHSLCQRFPALPATLRRDTSVLATVRAAVAPLLERLTWYHELCGWLQPQAAEEQGWHQSRSGYAVTVSGPSSQGTNSRRNEGEPHLAAPAVQQQAAEEQGWHQSRSGYAVTVSGPSSQGTNSPAKEAATSKAEKSVKLEHGHGARVAMFSARFNEQNKDIEIKFRAVYKLLLENHYDVMMVEAGPGESYGSMTAEYLQRLESENGIMLAVCTSDYGEMTDSPFSTYYELKHAKVYNLDVLPLQVEEKWKPNPPCGEGHRDVKKSALGFISMVFNPDLVRVDCRNKSIEAIASEIGAVLRKGTPA